MRSRWSTLSGIVARRRCRAVGSWAPDQAEGDQRFVASDFLRIAARRILHPVGHRLERARLGSPACNAQLCRNQAVIKLERLPALSSSRRPTARTSRPHQANVSNWAGRSTGEGRQIRRMLMANPRQLVRPSCHRPGRSLLTGSANLLNLRGVSKPQWSLCLVHAPWGSYLARGRLA